MTVLVDTSIWSLALRRHQRRLSADQRRVVDEWSRLVRAGQVGLVGPVRQEILSGMRRETDFQALRKRLRAFDDIAIERSDYEQAAHFFNRCRSKKVTGTPIDLLIAAVANRLGVSIFTLDTDFELYARHIPVRLHKPTTVTDTK